MGFTNFFICLFTGLCQNHLYGKLYPGKSIQFLFLNSGNVWDSRISLCVSVDNIFFKIFARSHPLSSNYLPNNLFIKYEDYESAMGDTAPFRFFNIFAFRPGGSWRTIHMYAKKTKPNCSFSDTSSSLVFCQIEYHGLTETSSLRTFLAPDLKTFSLKKHYIPPHFCLDYP